jgi:peroxiredoxin Q/BCP
VLRRALAGLLALFGAPAAIGAELFAGQPAPLFKLQDQDNRSHALADYRGRWVVLYFYPKDDTPGCTTEACSFRDNISAFTALGAQVLGVSLDDSTSHARFAEKFHLPFPLLADSDGRVTDSYGALWSAGPLRFARRHSFIIDPQGKLARVYRNVTPSTHTREVQDDLKGLMAARGAAAR